MQLSGFVDGDTHFLIVLLLLFLLTFKRKGVLWEAVKDELSLLTNDDVKVVVAVTHEKADGVVDDEMRGEPITFDDLLEGFTLCEVLFECLEEEEEEEKPVFIIVFSNSSHLSLRLTSTRPQKTFSRRCFIIKKITTTLMINKSNICLP
jgi:hypothetical protein